MTRPPDFLVGLSDSLKGRLVSHAAGVVFVAVALAGFALSFEANAPAESAQERHLESYLELNGVDFGDPLDRALFRESLDRFYPGQAARNDSLLQAIDDARVRRWSGPGLRRGDTNRGFSPALLPEIAWQFAQFLLVYILALLGIYFGAERLGLYRFVKWKQGRESYLGESIRIVREYRHARVNSRVRFPKGAVALDILKALGKGILTTLFFSPAYVIAYALKTSVDTSSLPFMILLALVSNGVLIQASNRFFELLVAEDRKGYVRTATVKNLHTSYEWNAKEGVPVRVLYRISQNLGPHVLRHLYENARFQFIPAMKELGSFLVTGLVIIEMALNIQGRLSYNLLQQILFGRYDVACVIIFSIFIAVKGTEVFVDTWHDFERRRYGF